MHIFNFTPSYYIFFDCYSMDSLFSDTEDISKRNNGEYLCYILFFPCFQKCVAFGFFLKYNVEKSLFKSNKYSKLFHTKISCLNVEWFLIKELNILILIIKVIIIIILIRNIKMIKFFFNLTKDLCI